MPEDAALPLYKAVVGVFAAVAPLTLLRPVLWPCIGAMLVAEETGWTAWRLRHTNTRLCSGWPTFSGVSTGRGHQGRDPW
ncbi:hypothetical protein GCM10023100_00230 [Actinocorallia cavernae]|uniref:Uncharacterized protein n=2 Tax=Actinomycetes TaxID=1760 RepID=A0ABP8S5F2_9ACTN